jgi:hypothetical protein
MPQLTTSKIPRYDLCNDFMKSHPQGDYVEFTDHDTVVSELQDRISELQKAVNAAFEAVRGEAT